MQTSDDVGGRSSPTYRDEDEPDVTATINVDDSIVRGTASVQQSCDVVLMTGGNVENLINVQSNEVGGEEHLKRVQSQADQRDSEVRVSNFVVSDRDTHDVRQDPRSMQMNQTADRGTTNDTPLSETVNAYPNSGLRVSFEDDWQEQIVSGGITATENRSNEPNIVLSSNQISEFPKEDDDSVTMPIERMLSEDQTETEAQVDGQHEEKEEEDKADAAEDSEEYSNDEDHVTELADKSQATVERNHHYNPNQSEIRECEQEQSQSEPSLGCNLENSVPVTRNSNLAMAAKDQDAANEAAQRQQEYTTVQNPDQMSVTEDEEVLLPQKQAPTDKNIIVQDELERLIVNLNHSAMACLKSDNFDKARQMLLKAETNLLQVDTQVAELQATSQSISNLGDPQFAAKAGIKPLDALKNRLLGLTYNNLGCLCKQKQDFHGALAYLKEALAYESRLEHIEEEERSQCETIEGFSEFEMDLRTLKCNSSGTILNICAILSKLKLHKQAHEYATEAVAKLRHSMKLTKTQVLQIQGNLDQVQERLERMTGNAFGDVTSVEEQDPEVVQLKSELLKCDVNKVELENQWVNLATTAVIAHYNAAVELEFMSCWREALAEYEKSAQLSALSMKSNNPMAVKIKQAIIKMRIKVRNNVQLPEKLAFEGQFAKQQKRANKSYVGSNRTEQQPRIVDFQNSVNSTRSSQFQKQYNRMVGAAPTSSNEYKIETTPKTVVSGTIFHPHTSLENTIPPLQTSHATQLPTSSMRISEQASSGNQQQRKVGLRPIINRNKDKSPISLRRIIDKLEQTEMQEAKKQNGLYRHTRFKSQRNPNAFNTVSHIGEDVSGPSGLTSALFSERKASNALSSNFRGGHESRNSNARHTINSAGSNSVDPNFLPSLNIATTGTISSRNNHRGSTVQGLRPIKSPLNQPIDRKMATGISKRKRGGGSKPPMMNAWGVGAADTIKQRQKQDRAISVGAGENHKFNTIEAGGVSGRKQSLNLSPTKLQMHLSIHNERKLIEQQNRLGTNHTKREQDISFFLSHIKRQDVKSKKTTKTTMLNTVSTDLTTVKQQLMLESQGSHLAGSAYLPKSLKNSIKQRQFVSQIKSMQKQIDREIQDQQLQLEPTLQMETQFQRQLALWKQEREQQLAGKLSEMEELKAEKDEYQAQLAEEFSTANVSKQDNITSNTPKLIADKMSADSADILSAEQAQEGISIAQDSQSKLTDKQGNQTGTDEEEVGNFRVSPAQTASMKANNLRMSQEREEHATLIGHGQIQILDEYGEHDDAKPGDKGEDDEQERPDTRAEVVLRSDDKTESGHHEHHNTGTSGAIISEYVSSKNELHQHTMECNKEDAVSGTAHEVDLEQQTKQLSETIEVEDIVSADTNNRQTEQIFQSFRTNSNGLRNNTETTPLNRTNNATKIYKNRFNTNSALQETDNNAAELDGNRSHNARSSFAMMMTNLDPMSGDQSLRNKHESMTAVSPIRLKNEPIISPQVHQEVTFEKQRKSQMTGRDSSIQESNASQTEMTVNEDGINNNGLGESTLNEETLNGWKLMKDSLTHSRQEPELTDDQVTILAEQSQIGDGPIYIQKSAERGRTTQRIYKTKTQVLDQDAQPRPDSRQVSDVTGTTDQIRYGTDSIIGILDAEVPRSKKKRNKSHARNSSLAHKSLAQTSEMIDATLAVGLSLEAQSIPDTTSDVTYKQVSFMKLSAQDRIHKKKNDHRIADQQSAVTPRAIDMSAKMKQSGKTVATQERSSLDTEKALRALPGHIHHSKKSSVTRPPPAGATTKRYVAVLAQKQQSLRPNFVKPLNLPSRNQNMPQTTKSSKIPQMIHIQQQSVVSSPLTNVTSPQQRAGSKQPKIMRQKTEIIKKSRANNTSKNHSSTREAVKDYTQEMGDIRGLKEGEKQPGQQQTEDRVAKIAQQITKLNTTLLQFQTEAEELKRDPMLKSTQRSNQSRHGLISQKSRDTNMTMPVVDSANVKALQEKRLIAQLQSAPGRSRRGCDSYMTEGRVQTDNMGLQQKPSETPIAERKQTGLLSNDYRNDVTVHSEVKSVETNQ